MILVCPACNKALCTTCRRKGFTSGAAMVLSHLGDCTESGEWRSHLCDGCTIPCDTCKEPTVMTGTKRCNRCWMIETHLADYLKSENGIEFARQALEAAGISTGDIRGES